MLLRKSSINAEENLNSPCLHLICVSLMEEFMESIEQVLPEVIGESSNAYMFFREQEISALQLHGLTKVVCESQLSDVVFDSITSIETCTAAFRMLASGINIHVLYHWTHRGAERRSTFSTLMREAEAHQPGVSRSELLMWRRMMDRMVRRIQFYDRFTFV